MSSLQCLRELIEDRLAVAVEEIFTVFQQTVVELEEQIDRQRRLLDIAWKPEIRLQRIELSQHVCKGEDIPADQTPQIKKEQEEPCTSPVEEQPILKKTTPTSTLTPGCEESDNRENQTSDLSPDEIQSAEEEPVIMSEPNSDDQLLSHHSQVANKGDKHEVQKPFKCDTCGKSFKHKSSLPQHIKSHTVKKPYLCNTCGKGFRCNSELKCHIRGHTGEKPYLCNTCGRGFKRNSELKCHIRSHAGEMPYLCNTCGRGFRYNRDLKCHIRSHAGEMPYLCITCGRGFRYNCELKCHIRGHTGEKPYLCNTCGRGFRRNSDLKCHVRSHTGEKPYL